jgi:hypothetical protein
VWCNSIVNNYLTSIAARTLNPAPSVRPRLGGRFEPASLIEGLIDSAKSSRRPAAKHSQPDSNKESISAIETREQGDPYGQPGKSFDPAPQVDRPAALTPEVNSRATTASHVTDSIVNPSPSSTIRATTHQTIAESPRQDRPVEVRPDEKVIHVSERTEFQSKTPPESRRENWPEPRVEESSGMSARVPHQAAEEVDPTPARSSSRVIKPSLRADDELEPVARPAITRKQPLIERELETIVIREKALRDESPLNQSSAKSPTTPVALSSDARENGGSKTPPVVVQSRIAPLIETGPEHVHLNRPAIQPQPTIHVTIGRIEVRAVQSSQPPARSRAATPVMNLDDYLKRRSQGGAR